MSKKILALILVAALAASMCLTPAMAAGKTYPDAVGNWAEKSITRWSDCGIITGDDTGLVHPGQYLRRCELATILVRLLGLTQRASGNTFTDVPAGAWYADAILKCAAAGIMEGYNGEATPEADVTREQAMTMIGRALGAQTRSGQSLDKFRDTGEVFDYARGYLTAFAAMGILNGVGDGTRIAPKQSIDRASAMTLLDRAIGAYVTTPGVVELKNANQFVVINVALAGEVTVTGQCAGVLVTTGNRSSVKLSRLTADTLKIDSPVKVTLVSSTKIDAIDLNAPGELQIDSSCAVGGINTDDAVKNGVAPIINNQGANKNNSSSGGGGGGGYRPTPSKPSPAPSAAPEYSITLDTETVSLKVGQTKAVTATVTPAGASMSYTLSPDTGIVAVDINGSVVTITALKAGTVGVTVAVTNGPSKTIAVTVTAEGEPSPSAAPSAQPSGSPAPSAQPSGSPTPSTPPSADPSTRPSAAPEYSITLDTAKVSLQEGESRTVTATVTPAGAAVYATSSDTSVVSVSVDGNKVTITAVKKGTATVSVKTADGASATIAVTVRAEGEPPEEPVYSITLDTTPITLKMGGTVTKTITVTVDPEGAEVYAISPDTSVVRVAVDGNKVTITALKDGTATVTIGVRNGPSKEVAVTVKAADVPGSGPDEPGTVTVDKTALNEAITAAEAEKEGVVIAEEAGDVLETIQWVRQGDMDHFTAAIYAAQDVADNAEATQDEVDAAVAALTEAIADFKERKHFGGKAPGGGETDPVVPNVTVTLRVNDAGGVVESVTLQGAGVTGADGVYTVKKDVDVTVVVTLKAGLDASAYTVSADTDVTFTLQGSTFTSTAVKAADKTITVTVTGAKEELWQLIVQAKTELPADGVVPSSAQETLLNAINAAFAVHQKADATGAELKEARSELDRAYTEFRSHK